MRRLIVLASLALLMPVPFAAPLPREMRDEVLAGAQLIGESTLAGDYGPMVNRMHPKVLEMMGGKESVLELVRDSMVQLDETGYKITGFEIRSAGPLFESAEDYLVFVATETTITTVDGTLYREGFLLASRPKSGGAWVYLDGSGLKDREGLELLFSGLPEEMALPQTKDRFEAKQPVEE